MRFTFLSLGVPPRPCKLTGLVTLAPLLPDRMGRSLSTLNEESCLVQLLTHCDTIQTSVRAGFCQRQADPLVWSSCDIGLVFLRHRPRSISPSGTPSMQSSGLIESRRRN